MFTHLPEKKLRQTLLRVSSWTAPLMASRLLLPTVVFVTTYLLSKFVHLCEFHRSLALLLSFILNKHNEPDAFLHSTYLTKTVSNRAKLKAWEKVMF